MRSKLLNSKIIFSILMASAMVVEPFAVYADANINGQDDAAFTCSSAINVMDCINQTQNPSVQQQSAGNLKTAIPVSSQTFGFTGPVSFNVRYDQDLSFILDAGYAQSFGNRAAVALKASAGQNELRGNGTIGFALSPKQQIKFTYEYLTQNLPFDYTAGTINEWVSQNAYGAAYRYMLGNSILQGIELSGSYTKANSKELSEVNIEDSGQIDQRRIAGGQQKNGLASVILTPFKNTILKIGAGYSASSFDTQWTSNQAQSTIAYNVEATHLLTPKTLISTSVNNTSTNRAHTVKVSRILPGSIEGNITGQYNVSHVEGIESNASVTAGLSYPAPKTYTNMFAGGIGDLKAWVNQPVIYNNRVLAIAEEQLLSTSISASPIPLATVGAGAVLDPIETKQYFTYNPKTFSKIDYNISSIIKKNDPTVTFQPSYLNLQLIPSASDNYNATLQSSAGMPATAMQPGQYTLTLSALGYRNGVQVGAANTTMDISVTSNPALPAPSWKANASLTPAIVGSPYPGTDLLTLVTDNSGLPSPGDQYTFTIENNPSWITLDSSTGHTLIASNNAKVPQGATNPTPVKIKVTSRVSGNVITGGNPDQNGYTTFNIAISNTGTAPVWKNDADTLPNPVLSQDYATKNPSFSLFQYVAKSGTDSTTMDYACVSPQSCVTSTSDPLQPLPVSGMWLNRANGIVSGSPNDPSQLNLAKTFQVKVTNSAKISSDAHTFTLTLSTNDTLKAPAWIPGKTTYPPAYAKQAYNTDLNDYFQSQNSPDEKLTYVLILNPNDHTCDWLGIASDGHTLTNKNGIPSVPIADCKIKITATSTWSNKSYTQDKIPLTVSGEAPIWSTNVLPDVTYGKTVNPVINLNPLVTDNNPGETFGFSIQGKQNGTDKLPSGLVLDENSGTITGQPNLISEIDSSGTKAKPITVTIRATSTKNANYYADNDLKIDVLPNGSLAWNFKNSEPSMPTGVVNLPYVDTANPSLDLNTVFQSNITGDSLYNYNSLSVDCNNNSFNLTSDGILTSKGLPTNPTYACKISFNVSSKATGTQKPASSSKFTILQDVLWDASASKLWTGKGHPVPRYMDNAPTHSWSEMIFGNTDPNNDYVKSQTGGLVSLTLTANQSVAIANTNNRGPNAFSLDGTTDKLDSVGDTCKGSFTLTAGSTVDGTGATQPFTGACLAPNTDLIAPVPKTEVLGQANYGTPVTIYLNPYDQNADQAGKAVVFKTKQVSTDVPDALTFSLDSNVIDGKACGWLALTNTPGTQTATLTGTNVGGLQTCQFNLGIFSKARGTSTSTSVKVTMNGTAPMWNVDGNNFPPLIKFSDIETRGINLTQAINGNGKAFLDPGTSSTDSNFRVEINDNDTRRNCGTGVVCSKRWKIYQSGGAFYLSRNILDDGSLDATDVTQQETVVMDAYNSASPGTPISQAVTITVTPNGNVTFKWTGGTIVGNVKTPGTFPNDGKSLTDYISTVLNQDGKDLTVKDKTDLTTGAGGCLGQGILTFKIDTTNGGGPNDQCIYPTGSAGAYVFYIMGTIENTYSGTYNDVTSSKQGYARGNIVGLKSTARGTTADTQVAGLNIVIQPQITWKSTNGGDIKFDATDKFPSDYTGIKLNDLINNPGQFSNLSFSKVKVTGNNSSADDWDVQKGNGTDWYLVRVKTNNQLNGGDIGSTVNITFSVTADNSTPAPATPISFNVKPDSAVTLNWYVEGQGVQPANGGTVYILPNDVDPTTQERLYNLAGNSGTEGKALYLRSCLPSDPTCTILIKNDKINNNFSSMIINGGACGNLNSKINFNSGNNGADKALRIIQSQIKSTDWQCATNSSKTPYATVGTNLNLYSKAQGSMQSANWWNLELKACTSDTVKNPPYPNACKTS